MSHRKNNRRVQRFKNLALRLPVYRPVVFKRHSHICLAFLIFSSLPNFTVPCINSFDTLLCLQSLTSPYNNSFPFFILCSLPCHNDIGGLPYNTPLSCSIYLCNLQDSLVAHHVNAINIYMKKSNSLPDVMITM